MYFFNREIEKFFDSTRNSNKVCELWLSKIQNAGGSIYDCQRVYGELSNQKPNLKPELFQKLINKIIESCIELKYSSALALAKKICSFERYELDHCEAFTLSEKSKKELHEQAEMVTYTFNQMFNFSNDTTLFLTFGSLIDDLTAFNETDKLIIMNDLIKGRVVRIFQNNSPSVFFIYSKEKIVDESNPRQVIRIVDQSNRLKIGEGNFGSVYEVSEIGMQNTVKKKVIKEYKMEEDEEIFFEKSFEAFEKLCQENVCREIVKGRQLKKNCLYMNRFEMDLKKWFKKLRIDQELSQEQLSSIMTDCLAGLAYIHSKKMCHQDIKLTNILVKNGKCAIGDFDFLFDQNFTNVNFLLKNTPSYVFIQDHIELFKIITVTKTGVHDLDEDGYEPKSHRNRSYTYEQCHIEKLIELKQSMDVAALGLVFLEGVTGLKSISWNKKESLYKMAMLSSEKQPELPLAYMNSPKPNVQAEYTIAGQEAIEQAKLMYGNDLISLIMSMVDPFESRPSAKMVLSRLASIDRVFSGT